MTALIYLNEAIAALSLETTDQNDNPVDPLQSCISLELERIDRAIGGERSMLAALADCVNQAMVAVVAAKKELER